MVILLIYMNKNKLFIIYLLSLVLLVVLFIVTKSTYIFALINIYIYANIYFFYKQYSLQKEEEKYVEDKVKIAQEDVLNTPDVIVIVKKNSKIVWANENAYEVFPHIKRDRSINFLLENIDDKLFEFNNKVFKVFSKEDIYFLLEVTTDYRHQKKLEEIQTIIGFFQIDNMDSLKNSMEAVEYLNFSSVFINKMSNLFLENKIYYKQIDDKTYYLNIPYDYLQKSIEERFKDIGDIIKEFHDQDIVVSTTMGIAYNYGNVSETGKKAQEALELAISRGGAQIVVFNNEKTLYFGGGFTTNKGSYRLRARIIANTLKRIIKEKEQVFLVTHENPDYDGVSACLLMYEFLKKQNIEVKFLIDSEESIKEFGLDKIEFNDDIVENYTIDKTKKNILISLDTQSKDIISHPEVLEEINEVIVIDHHQTPINYFRGNLFSWIEPNASSTVELVMSILLVSNELSKTPFINDMALLGVLTDTNRLKYRTSHQTLDVVMNLVAQGASIGEGLEKLYLNKSEYLEKQQYIDKVEFLNGFSLVRLEEEIDDILMSIIADDILQIREVRGAIIYSKIENDSENYNHYRLKIRTKNNLNAKSLIEEFGGGGHFLQAAGILEKEKLDKFLEKITNLDFE